MPTVRFPSLLNLVPTPTLHHHIRGYKVEPWEDPSLLLSISRDTLRTATSVSRPQRPRTYRDGLAWLVCLHWPAQASAWQSRPSAPAVQIVVRQGRVLVRRNRVSTASSATTKVIMLPGLNLMMDRDMEH